MKKAVLWLSLSILAAFPALGFEKVQNLALPAEGLARLDITAGAGFLTVTGRAGQTAIEVKAHIQVSGVGDSEIEEWIKNHVELELRKAGDTAVLVGEIRSRGFISFFDGEAKIDLTVSVPKTLALRIDDGSGEISVDGVEGNVDITDGSGGMEVRNVTGDVSVDDGSGGISLLKVGGNVTIDDGSGHLEIDDVGKDVRLKHKGSGSVDITNVRGKVIR